MVLISGEFWGMFINLWCVCLVLLYVFYDMLVMVVVGCDGS